MSLSLDVTISNPAFLNPKSSPPAPENNDIISIEVEDFLNSWKDGVIDIGIAYQEGIDYREKARAFIETHYAFDIGDVLFKPTFTNDVVFRNNLEDALSYFVADDISEDSGFAIKPWEDIKVSEVNLILENNNKKFLKESFGQYISPI